jgi:hypothetical protein
VHEFRTVPRVPLEMRVLRSPLSLQAPVHPGTVMRRLADQSTSGSFSNLRRSRRFEAFEAIVAELQTGRDDPLHILDIGGTNSFWEQRGWQNRNDVDIMLINVEAEERCHSNIDPRAGDAADLSEYPDGAFDIVFSNSVIEHLYTRANQERMAREVRRLAAVFWVQTPNFWFPVEPHFLTPAWHWLPVAVRVWLLQRRRWGWRGPCPEKADAEDAVREVRLLRGSELRRLFPDARLVAEKFGPLVKSYIAIRD